MFVPKERFELSNLSALVSKTSVSANSTIRVNAESVRFELTIRTTPYDDLANRWFQPLTQLSFGVLERYRPVLSSSTN